MALLGGKEEPSESDSHRKTCLGLKAIHRNSILHYHNKFEGEILAHSVMCKTTLFHGARLSKSGVPCQEDSRLVWAIALVLKVRKERAKLMSVTGHN